MTAEQGIYQIVHIPSGQAYIGSTKGINRRLQTHRWLLKTNRHYNPKLQASWNKHGECEFAFERIELVDKEEDLIEREQHYLDRKTNLFNIFRIAERGRHYQYQTPSEDKKAKTPEHRAKLAAHLTALNKARAGIPLSELHKAKIKASVNQPEVIEKIKKSGETRKGKKRGPYARRQEE